MNTNWQNLVVEVVVRVVQRASASAGAVAQPDIAAGLDLQHVSEVFGAHRWQFILAHLVFAQKGGGGLPAEAGFCRAVDRRRIALVEADADLRTKRAGNAGAQTL